MNSQFSTSSMDVNDNANVFNNNNADVVSHDERIKKFIKLNSGSSKSDISYSEKFRKVMIF